MRKLFITSKERNQQVHAQKLRPQQLSSQAQLNPVVKHVALLHPEEDDFLPTALAVATQPNC